MQNQGKREQLSHTRGHWGEATAKCHVMLRTGFWDGKRSLTQKAGKIPARPGVLLTAMINLSFFVFTEVPQTGKLFPVGTLGAGCRRNLCTLFAAFLKIKIILKCFLSLYFKGSNTQKSQTTQNECRFGSRNSRTEPFLQPQCNTPPAGK